MIVINLFSRGKKTTRDQIRIWNAIVDSNTMQGIIFLLTILVGFIVMYFLAHGHCKLINSKWIPSIEGPNKSTVDNIFGEGGPCLEGFIYLGIEFLILIYAGGFIFVLKTHTRETLLVIAYFLSMITMWAILTWLNAEAIRAGYLSNFDGKSSGNITYTDALATGFVYSVIETIVLVIAGLIIACCISGLSSDVEKLKKMEEEIDLEAQIKTQ